MRKNNRERGTVLVMTAILTPVLIFILGFAIDFGVMFAVRNAAQNAADAAAIAGVYASPTVRAVTLAIPQSRLLPLIKPLWQIPSSAVQPSHPRP